MLGVCPDHHTHFNLILFINEVINGNICWCHIKDYIREKKEKIKLLWKKSVMNVKIKE